MNFAAKGVVLTTGTFMNGKIWVGRASMAAGRAGEAPSTGLTEMLVGLGFETDRLKTGTPARVDSRSVDFQGLEEQPGRVRELLGVFWVGKGGGVHWGRGVGGGERGEGALCGWDTITWQSNLKKPGVHAGHPWTHHAIMVT